MIGFGYGDAAETLATAQAVQLAVQLWIENTSQGRTSLQLMLKDYEVKQPQVIDWRMPTIDGGQFESQPHVCVF